MLKKLAISVIIATTSLTSLAEESKDFYAQVNAGYAWGMSDTFSFSSEISGNTYPGSKKLKTGKTFSIGLEGGYSINEMLRLGLSFDYLPDFSVNPKEVTVNDDKFFKDGNSKIKSMNIMFNAFLDAGNYNGFKPYLVVGVGAAQNKSNDIKNESGSNKLLTGKKKTNFAWKAGLGVKYAVNDNIDVDLRYQYLDLGKASWDANNTDQVKYSISDMKLKANQVMFGVAYKF